MPRALTLLFTALFSAGILGAGAHAADAAGPLGPNPGLKYYYPVPMAEPAQTIDVDVAAYGATPASIAATVQASRMGKKTALFVFRRHVGGMTSGGLTATDVGNAKGIGGMAQEFYKRVGKLRGFLPSQAETAFLGMLADANVPIYYEHRLKSVKKDGSKIVELEFENGNKVRAKTYVDGTYEGDLLAMAGVSYHVGREANSVYNETINGVQFHKAHNFNYPVDPYKVEGDANSGLCFGISAEDPGKSGEGDKRIQAYNFRMQISNADNRLPFPKPADYDASWYVLLERYLKKKPDLKWSFNYGDGPVQLYNGDCNNAGGFSTDFIGENYRWPEAGYTEREAIFQAHVKYQQGFMYFLASDPSLPEEIRERVKKWGLHPTEFPETGGWPHELYVREGRRMISDYVMTQANCQSKIVAEDSVGLASYTMDSHNCQRIVMKDYKFGDKTYDAVVRNEGDVQTGVPHPYPVSYRSIVPKETECSNLFVPLCLSSTHISYGSIRMEPVFMILGQSAGTAACLAIDANVPVQKVDYANLKERLLADSQILTFEAPAKDEAKKKK
jgi:hypothetical protein